MPPVDRKLYDVLGVDPGASEDDLRKAFRKAALKHHPDKGGDAEAFKEVSRAYEVLSNPELRQVYDATGQTDPGVAAAGPPPGDMFDRMFREFDFGFGFPFGGGPARAHDPAPPAEAHLRVRMPLKDAFHGCSKTFQIKEDVPCTGCQGSGCVDKRRPPCMTCQGQGVQTRMERMGPFIQHLQAPCRPCSGTGKGAIPPGRECSACSASGQQKLQETVRIQIPAGVRSGDVIQQRRADGRLLTLTIEVESPPGWQRRGDDLHVRIELELVDALLGFETELTHPSGATLAVTSPADRPLEPGATWNIAGQGMPRRGPGSGARGDLIVEIGRIRWPKTVTMTLQEALRTELPERCVQVQT